MTQKMSNKNKAFTLIELLVVIAIIALLTGMTVYLLSNYRGRLRDTQRIAAVVDLQKALTIYQNTNNSYPFDPSPVCDSPGCVIQPGNTTLQDLIIQFLLTRLPQDPLNTPPYQLLYIDSGNDGASYRISYTLETNSGAGTVGVHTIGP